MKDIKGHAEHMAKALPGSVVPRVSCKVQKKWYFLRIGTKTS